MRRAALFLLMAVLGIGALLPGSQAPHGNPSLRRSAAFLMGQGAWERAGGLSPAPRPAPAAARQEEPPEDIPDATCLGCHGNPDLTMPLENGEVLGLFVPQEVYGTSVHGELGLRCVQCHSQVGDYPHPPYTAVDLRQVSLDLVTLCAQCHADLAEQTRDSVHERARQAGNREAAICTDCHTAHAVRRLTEPDAPPQTSAAGLEIPALLPDARPWVSQTCAKCHFAIFQRYAESVHGTALLEESNPDVPTCIDCHGVHNIEDPGTTEFRLSSPQICARCHTDPQVMDKYGISTNVLETYVADFHGTTVTLFEQQHPDQEANEAVCYDCHGIHDITRVDDPEKGLLVKQNLLARCQQCHPDASENFPTAWLSHYIPSPERYPLVFTVDTFYRLLIPTVLGGMAVLVALDFGSGLWKRARGKRVESIYPPSPLIPEEEGEGIEEAGQPSAVEEEKGIGDRGVEVEEAPPPEAPVETQDLASLQQQHPPPPEEGAGGEAGEELPGSPPAAAEDVETQDLASLHHHHQQQPPPQPPDEGAGEDEGRNGAERDEGGEEARHG